MQSRQALWPLRSQQERLQNYLSVSCSRVYWCVLVWEACLLSKPNAAASCLQTEQGLPASTQVPDSQIHPLEKGAALCTIIVAELHFEGQPAVIAMLAAARIFVWHTPAVWEQELRALALAPAAQGVEYQQSL